MNLEEFNIIIFITGIIIGCIACYALKRLNAKRVNEQINSNSNVVTMKSLQQELDSKQVIIDNFFFDSNEQLMAIEKRLESLRNNLADNSKQLSNVVIEKSTSKVDELETPDTAAPPRDYALKTDKEPGMLSETFGLGEKEDLEPKRSI
ncbi:hypothetical protein MUS1_07470 [Marinomonas ushuaiensis DSM 15871]|uniref:DUF1043 family protein n=1 Tax=Marinomonas ushuaiensis DSM 15871 TaxID=1122207 RepID=X7E7D0_9GAMM|nr:DUF1043 family protein [Marinomonas ushuaiensis]ETX11775.1 hypothetical protein MUS1_07470 [Marinomonas ushuaiensis DSM 15871]